MATWPSSIADVMCAGEADAWMEESEMDVPAVCRDGGVPGDVRDLRGRVGRAVGLGDGLGLEVGFADGLAGGDVAGCHDDVDGIGLVLGDDRR